MILRKIKIGNWKFHRHDTFITCKYRFGNVDAQYTDQFTNLILFEEDVSSIIFLSTFDSICLHLVPRLALVGVTLAN